MNEFEDYLEAWSDSDWCGDKVGRKSTYGYFFKYLKAPISWCSKKKTVVTLSSCEAEYIAATEANCQCVWLESMLDDLKLDHVKPMQLCVDNQSTINLAKNSISHGRSKHIETKFHFLREQVGKGKLEVKHCNTKKKVTDIFTKPLKLDRFEELRE